jgi:hypothetical protein
MSLHQGPNSIRRRTHRDIPWTSDRDMARPQRVKGHSPAIHPIWFGSVPELVWRLAESLMKANEGEGLTYHVLTSLLHHEPQQLAPH